MSPIKRQFPGAKSPLAADIESIRIGAQAETDQPAPVAYLPTPVTSASEALQQPDARTDPPATVEDAPPPSVAEAAAGPEPVSPAPVVTFDPKERKATTIPVEVGLKKQAETAILLTKKIPGHYKSWAAFVNGAVANELQRLAGEINGGVAFEMNTGDPLPTGRPADDK